MKCTTCRDMGYVIVNGHEKIRCPSVHHMGKMLTLSLTCSTLSVHPPALPNDPPLVATIADVEPEEVLRQIEISEVVKHYGAQDLLSAIGWENVKQHFDL